MTDDLQHLRFIERVGTDIMNRQLDLLPLAQLTAGVETVFSFESVKLAVDLRPPAAIGVFAGQIVPCHVSLFEKSFTHVGHTCTSAGTCNVCRDESAHRDKLSTTWQGFGQAFSIAVLGVDVTLIRRGLGTCFTGSAHLPFGLFAASYEQEFAEPEQISA
jgi:hypothetical protein